ncbi:hypothetical protein BASA81_009258 [Batrachochytrium salamandrivorans]|nr:hypothetical protein BASA81_009258 [Batrachochytrium salamandrivorans]
MAVVVVAEETKSFAKSLPGAMCRKINTAQHSCGELALAKLTGVFLLTERSERSPHGVYNVQCRADDVCVSNPVYMTLNVLGMLRLPSSIPKAEKVAALRVSCQSWTSGMPRYLDWRCGSSWYSGGGAQNECVDWY